MTDITPVLGVNNSHLIPHFTVLSQKTSRRLSSNPARAHLPSLQTALKNLTDERPPTLRFLAAPTVHFMGIQQCFPNAAEISLLSISTRCVPSAISHFSPLLLIFSNCWFLRGIFHRTIKTVHFFFPFFFFFFSDQGQDRSWACQAFFISFLLLLLLKYFIIKECAPNGIFYKEQKFSHSPILHLTHFKTHSKILYL